MTKGQALRDQSLDELEAQVVDTRKELFDLVNEVKHAKSMEQPHLLHEKKKNIARLMTIITEKRRSEQK